MSITKEALPPPLPIPCLRCKMADCGSSLAFLTLFAIENRLGSLIPGFTVAEAGALLFRLLF